MSAEKPSLRTPSGQPAPKSPGRWQRLLKRLKPSLVFFLLALLAGLFVGLYVAPTWTVERIGLDVTGEPGPQVSGEEPAYVSADALVDGKRLVLFRDRDGRLLYESEGETIYLMRAKRRDSRRLSLWQDQAGHLFFQSGGKLFLLAEGEPAPSEGVDFQKRSEEQGSCDFEGGRVAVSRLTGSQAARQIVLEADDGTLFRLSAKRPAYLSDGSPICVVKGKPQPFRKLVPLEESPLAKENIRRTNAEGDEPAVEEQYTYERPQTGDGPALTYFKLAAQRHWRWWSLLPAAVAVGLCWTTREPLVSLLGGILVGAFILGRYDVTDAVFVASFATENAAGVLLLYLWLLGGLLGVWSRTGAAQAFADLMTRTFVRGPKTAKLVAWCLGVIFFQGGTVSTVLVGTTVKPLADRERISHEELAYIVDATASPIASLLAFNAWPGYVQAFVFVAGVSWLATEELRIRFFFMSVPLCFYAIFAVAFTFLLSFEWMPLVGRRMREAIKRARDTGRLDHPEAEPLAAQELHASRVPEGYTPHVIDFFAPLVLLIGVAVGTFIVSGSPQVRWAFGAALVLAVGLALARGMRLKTLVEGLIDGLKGVVLGSVILLLAITIGNISKDAGGGIYLVELLGDRVPYWALPVLLEALTIIISFSTGTSWGTYAIAFPLAMPLAAAVASVNGLAHPMLFMALCFAAVMDGSVFGDQCSPISDTTVLSSMCCGCDLMDHVRTQIPQASVAALLAAVCWTVVTVMFC
jgi:Na+/H+ antiporter NhaC